jgi:transposase InsO family protein
VLHLRGVSLRMDHGTQFLSDHYQQQVRLWGITPSFAFLAQPQTNGVAERFIREWLIEKLRHRSPLQAREGYGTLSTA